ncbi:protein KINESIN LIGHT CHAIN-RELATED 1 [Ananas comosus]|uniref:Protein KINESIN LIGHT CHAIN-RELATED 1 n=1 Tax=Ananas comosus TaxID=4615 RepID=A0A6P5GY01_ANACO|nr:protein KINESIN LIGHT CHAIN-RELATED 1 [Ananas comosus]XP_020112688.1 protein KINESIN LIGHT CHAIN-RELATED 1 [Ananas comosus]
MIGASSRRLLLSTLLKSKPFLRSLPKPLLSSSIPPPHSPLSSSAKTLSFPLVNPRFLHPSPRALQTCSQNAPPLSPRQRKLQEKSDLEEAFESATNTEEIFGAFEALESALDPSDKKLGLACLKVGQHLDATGSPDHEKVLNFGLRALRILDSGGESSVSVAMALHLVGSACFELKRFNDSLGFLNRANRILTTLENEGSGDFDVRPVSHAVQLQLANTKTAMGRREEALTNLRRCLELKESILDPNSRELGVGYRDLAEAYAAVLNFKEALPLCLKALEIHKAQLGLNSVEVAHDRRLLGVIYTGLEEHEKALEQNELSQKVLKNWGMDSDLLHAEIDAANIKIALGKYEEAVNTLKRVAEQSEKESETRALVFISMAKALSNQEKVEDSKRCLKIACGILEKKELISPARVSEAYVEISSLYEAVNEFDTAISLLKKSLFMLERLPQEQHMEGNVAARIGWLLLLTGKVAEAVPYLESAAERMKESFGPKHFGVGYVYNNLGAAYMEMDRPQSAAQMFALAKEIMDVSLGPHHTDSIEACQSLANAYAAMGSYALALEFQKRVIDAWGNHGPSARDELKEANRLYDKLKKKAFASLSGAVPEEDSVTQREGSDTDPPKMMHQ